MKKRIDSDSSVQRDIENYMLGKVRKLLNDGSLQSVVIPLNAEQNSVIHPDFYSESRRIIGEIHAHVGRLKGSQLGKIAKDILKMLLLEKIRDCTYEKYIVVCDRTEWKQLIEGNSFLALTIKTYNVNVLLIELVESDYERLKLSMKRQNLMDE